MTAAQNRRSSTMASCFHRSKSDIGALTLFSSVNGSARGPDEWLQGLDLFKWWVGRFRVQPAFVCDDCQLIWHQWQWPADRKFIVDCEIQSPVSAAINLQIIFACERNCVCGVVKEVELNAICIRQHTAKARGRGAVYCLPGNYMQHAANWLWNSRGSKFTGCITYSW
jgi:hypothetical protein